MSEIPAAALRQRFLDGMSHAAATVNIVTTDGEAGRHGVTVSAMSSVSADSPNPSLLICVHHLSQTCSAIQANGVFCVNVLRDSQSAISDTFASRLKSADGDKFSCAQWTTQKTGAPRIVDPLVAFDCVLKETVRYGSHQIFIGEVVDIFARRKGNPLIYANRAYGTPSRLDSRHAANANAANEELRLGAIVTLAPFLLPELVARLAESHPGLAVRLIERPHTELIEALHSGTCQIALTFGIDLGRGVDTTALTEMPTYALLPDGHPLARDARVSLHALASEPMILLDQPMRRDFYLGLFRAHGLEPNIRMESSNFETVRGLVGHGLGYTLLGAKPASAMTYDGRGLVSRPIIEDGGDSTIVLASLPQANEAWPVRALRAVCRDLFES